jgi:predicted ferric reductase
MNTTSTASRDFEQPAVPWPALLVGLTGMASGALLAAIVLPAWLPNLTASLVGASPKVFWFLSRASALIALWMLWFSMAWGLLISGKLSRAWPGGSAAFDLHQYTSLLGLSFSLFHFLILLGDRYIHYNLMELILPFAGQGFEPFWVGLGQLAFYLLALVVASFYVRRWIGVQSWRWIHYASFLTFLLALVHGIASGTDSQTLWAGALNWFYVASLLFLGLYRVLATRPAPQAGQ